MNFIKKLTTFLLLCLSAQNILQAGILNNVQQIIPASSTLSNLLQSMPDNNKIMAYAGAAAIATGAGIGFNVYTDLRFKHYKPWRNIYNFIPWIPGMIRTTKKHPYATAGIAAALGASYGLYKHPETLKDIQKSFNNQPLGQKIQQFSINHPDLTWLAKMYLFCAAYVTGVGLNFAIWTKITESYKKDPRWRDVPAVGLFPYSYGLYLLARYK